MVLLLVLRICIDVCNMGLLFLLFFLPVSFCNLHNLASLCIPIVMCTFQRLFKDLAKSGLDASTRSNKAVINPSFVELMPTQNRRDQLLKQACS